MTDKELQEIKARYTEGNTQYRDVGKCTVSDFKRLFKEIEQLQSENIRLKAERDKAVEDLQEITKYNGSLCCHCNDMLSIANKWRGLEGTE